MLTGEQAKQQAAWNNLSKTTQDCIINAVEEGKRYVDVGIRLSDEQCIALQDLGYYIYSNRHKNTHEIRW